MFCGLIDSQGLQGNSWKQRQRFPAVIKRYCNYCFLISQPPSGEAQEELIATGFNCEGQGLGRCSPLSLRAVGKTSRLMEPQGKKIGGIFVSSSMMRNEKKKVMNLINVLV